jgi:hypothetical protein
MHAIDIEVKYLHIISFAIDIKVKHLHITSFAINPILHTAWLDNHALNLKSNSAKYYFYEKSRFLHTFLNFVVNQGKFKSSSKSFYFQCFKC